MIEKVLDRLVPPYFIFGEKGDTVDLADINGDVVTGISRAHAERLIVDQAKLRAVILEFAPEEVYRVIKALFG